MGKKNVLFISYDGLLDPLGKSQILPYLIGLSERGFRFNILSFEKINKNINEFERLEYLLNRKNLKWYRLSFQKGKFQNLIRIIKGAFLVNYICRNNTIDIVHCRTILSSLIYFFSFINKQFIYDMRSFSGQWVETKAIKKNSLLHGIFRILEDYLIKRAAGVVVLDKSGAKYLENNYKKKILYKIIPTSTNLSNYKAVKNKKKKEIKFVFLGGVSYPYLPYEALMFINQLKELGFNCKLDFINKGEHKVIEKICSNINFPVKNISIKEIPNEKIPKELNRYDCGLVFIAEGKWLSMSSPTKIGEYLASGLFVLSLEGLNVTQRLAKSYDSVEIIRRDFLVHKIQKIEAKKLFEKINAPRRSRTSIKIAKKEYYIKLALDKYENLYKAILI